MNNPAKKYRRRKTVEAVRITRNNSWEIREWSEDMVIASPVLEPTSYNPSGVYLQIESDHLPMETAIVGEWIVKKGPRIYIHHTDDVFHQLYELEPERETSAGT